MGRDHKYDTYVTCPFGSAVEDDTLPTLTNGEQRILDMKSVKYLNYNLTFVIDGFRNILHYLAPFAFL